MTTEIKIFTPITTGRFSFRRRASRSSEGWKRKKVWEISPYSSASSTTTTTTTYRHKYIKTRFIQCFMDWCECERTTTAKKRIRIITMTRAWRRRHRTRIESVRNEGENVERKKKKNHLFYNIISYINRERNRPIFYAIGIFFFFFLPPVNTLGRATL